MTNARLDDADLSSANLAGASLHGASLVRAKLVRTALREANLAQSQLDEADLSHADLTNANLEGASLRGCNLTNATLTGAKLDEADLRYARGIWFDETEVRRTRFTVQIGWVGRLAGGLWLRFGHRSEDAEGRARHRSQYPLKGTDDPWSALRRSYTGPAFARTLLALTLFLLPNVLRTAGLVFFSEAESQFIGTVATTARSIAATLAPDDAPTSPAQATQLMWIVGALEGIERRPRYDVWQVLLGIHKGDWQSNVSAFLFGLLLFYNLALRYPLTVAVSGLREAEERSGVTPARSEYEHLYQLHRVASILWWLALISGIVNLGRWLLSDVVFVW